MTETLRMMNEDGTLFVYDERSSMLGGQQHLKRYNIKDNDDDSNATSCHEDKFTSICPKKEYYPQNNNNNNNYKYGSYGLSIGIFLMVLFCLLLTYVTYLGQSILHELRLYNSNYHHHHHHHHSYYYDPKDSIGKDTIQRRDDEVMGKEKPSRRDSSNFLKSKREDNNSSSSILKVLIVYVDGHEHSMAMAEEVRRGALSVVALASTVDVKVMTTINATFQDVLDCDGFILGSPVYNANVHPQLQSWINQEWDIQHRLQWKVGGVFVTAGGISAGEESTMLSLQRTLQIFEMIVVGGKSWTSAFGASAITYESPFGNNHCFPNTDDGIIHSMFLKKAYELGQRVTTVSYTIQQGQGT